MSVTMDRVRECVKISLVIREDGKVLHYPQSTR